MKYVVERSDQWVTQISREMEKEEAERFAKKSQENWPEVVIKESIGPLQKIFENLLKK